MLNRRKSHRKIAWLLSAMLFLQSCSLIIINDPTADGRDPLDTDDSYETVQPIIDIEGETYPFVPQAFDM